MIAGPWEYYRFAGGCSTAEVRRVGRRPVRRAELALVTSASWPEAYPEGTRRSGFGVPGSPDALRHVMGHFARVSRSRTRSHHGIKHAMTATAVCSCPWSHHWFWSA
jgi:hypothetical protein